MTRNEFYQFVGKFAVEFEGVCSEMEDAIEDVFNRAGLECKNIQERIGLTNIILDNKTAEPLQKMLRALWVNELENSEATIDIQDFAKKVITFVFSAMQKVIKERNLIIHSKWVIPRDEQGNGKKTVLGRKCKSSSSGDSTEFPAYSPEDFNNAINRCKEVKKMIACVKRSIYIDMYVSLNKSFAIDNRNKISFRN